MTNWTLEKIRVTDGIWHGQLNGPTDVTPDLSVTHLNVVVPGHFVAAANAGGFIVNVPIPAHLLADGVQTFVISDVTTDTVLASFTILCGDALAEDIRAEMGMLRAELDLLKRAFRRHCVETLDSRPVVVETD